MLLGTPLHWAFPAVRPLALLPLGHLLGWCDPSEGQGQTSDQAAFLPSLPPPYCPLLATFCSLTSSEGDTQKARLGTAVSVHTAAGLCLASHAFFPSQALQVPAPWCSSDQACTPWRAPRHSPASPCCGHSTAGHGTLFPERAPWQIQKHPPLCTSGTSTT